MTQAFHRPLLRTRQFCFRLSEEEEQRLLAIAQHAGLDASNALRLLIKQTYDKLPNHGSEGAKDGATLTVADACAVAR